jgi:superfamily II DNA helicase RecQ
MAWNIFILVIYCRGEYFRREFSNLGQVRSLIPSTVNVMALTATATKTTRDKIIAIFGMLLPKIALEKSNITYWVSSVEEVFTPIADKLKCKRANMPRVIIFCKRCEECAILYQFFLSTLKKSLQSLLEHPISLDTDL